MVDEEAEWKDEAIYEVITVVNILIRKVCNRINYSSIKDDDDGEDDESGSEEEDESGSEKEEEDESGSEKEEEDESGSEKEEDMHAHPISAFERMREKKTVDDSDLDSDDERKNRWITQGKFKKDFNMDIAMAASVIMRLKEDHVKGLNSDNESLHGDDADDCESVDELINATRNNNMAANDNEDYACTAKQFILQDGKSVRNPYYLTWKERRAIKVTENALKRAIAVRELAFENRNQKSYMLKFQHACEHVLAGFWGITDASRSTGISTRTLRRGMKSIILRNGIAGTGKPGRPRKSEMLELEKNKDELTWFNWSKAKHNSPHWSRKEDGTAMEPETSDWDAKYAIPERPCFHADAIARIDGMTNICLISKGKRLQSCGHIYNCYCLLIFIHNTEKDQKMFGKNTVNGIIDYSKPFQSTFSHYTMSTRSRRVNKKNSVYQRIPIPENLLEGKGAIANYVSTVPLPYGYINTMTIRPHEDSDYDSDIEVNHIVYQSSKRTKYNGDFYYLGKECPDTFRAELE